jgi:sugar phosphate isomerase/epimerase
MIIAASEWVLGDRLVAFRRARNAGFTAIELDAIPGTDIDALRASLNEFGLAVPSLCWMWNAENELGSPEASSRLAAQKYLLASLEQARELGATQLVVIPACRSVPWDHHESRHRGIERAADSISAVLTDAPENILLALESLRREESFLMNTLDESDHLRRMLDDRRVRLLADVYHMAHEEDDMIGALRAHAEHVSLLHFAAPERGPMLPTSPGIDGLVDSIRTIDSIQSMTLEFIVGEDDALLARGLDFAATV